MTSWRLITHVKLLWKVEDCSFKFIPNFIPVFPLTLLFHFADSNFKFYFHAEATLNPWSFYLSFSGPFLAALSSLRYGGKKRMQHSWCSCTVILYKCKMMLPFQFPGLFLNLLQLLLGMTLTSLIFSFGFS